MTISAYAFVTDNTINVKYNSSAHCSHFESMWPLLRDSRSERQQKRRNLKHQKKVCHNGKEEVFALKWKSVFGKEPMITDRYGMEHNIRKWWNT